MDINDMDYLGEEIKLAGKVRHIKYTIAGLKILARHFDSVMAAFDKMQKMDINFSVETLDDITLMLYAGLIHEDENLTIKQVENMVDFTTIMTVFEKIGKAIQGSNPQSNGGSEKPVGE
jgi:hypothetical protein